MRYIISRYSDYFGNIILNDMKCVDQEDLFDYMRCYGTFDFEELGLFVYDKDTTKLYDEIDGRDWDDPRGYYYTKEAIQEYITRIKEEYDKQLEYLYEVLSK